MPKDISKDRLKLIVSAATRGLWAGPQRARYAGFADDTYTLGSVAAVNAMLYAFPAAIAAPPLSPVLDCEDFAYLFKGHSSLYARDTLRLVNGFCCGIAWGSFSWVPHEFHACNFVVDDAGVFAWIEPQTRQAFPLNACTGDLELLLV